MKQLYLIHLVIHKIIKMLCNILTVIHIHLFLFLRTTQHTRKYTTSQIQPLNTGPICKNS